MQSDEVFTIREAAAFLRIHRVTMYRHAESGRIPGYKVGRIWRFDKSKLVMLLRGELNSSGAALSGEGSK